MLDALKRHFFLRTTQFLEEPKIHIEQAWNKRSTKTKCKLQQNFPKSLLPKYEHDKGVMVEAPR